MLLPPSRLLTLVIHYHLQGSTVQRQASEKEKAKELPTLKDNDFLEENYKILLPSEAKNQLMALLKSDTEFLTRLHMMDYSLLVGKHPITKRVTKISPGFLGIHDVDQGNKELEEGKNVIVSQQPYSSDSGDDAGPTPPDSPVPSVGAFALKPGSLNLDDEFFAIPSSDGTHCTIDSRAASLCFRIAEEVDLLHRASRHPHLLRGEETNRIRREVRQIRLRSGERVCGEAGAIREETPRVHQQERDLTVDARASCWTSSRRTAKRIGTRRCCTVIDKEPALFSV